MKNKFRFWGSVFMLFVISLSNVFLCFAGPFEEKRSPFFSFSLNMENDLQAGRAGVYLKDLIPGKQYKGTLVITNFDDVKATYQVKLGDGPIDEDLPPTGLASWIKIKASRGILMDKPNQKLEIPYVIDVPKDASPGDYISRLAVILSDYSANGLESKTEQKEGTTKVSIAVAQAGIITANVVGDIFLDVVLDQISWINKKGVGYYVNFSTTNNSSISVRPIIFVKVTDKDGTELFNDYQKFLISLHREETYSGEFFLEKLRELPYGKYDVTTELYFLSEYDYLKVYRDQSKIANKDDFQLASTADFSVWVLPYMTIYIIVGVVLVLIFIYMLWMYIRRKQLNK